VRVVLAALSLFAVVLGTAGVTTLLVGYRVAALAPGGVEISALQYNPLSGRLVLDGVRARDATGRVLFHADSVDARVSPFRLVQRPLTLSQARVSGPRLTLRAASGFDVVELAARFGIATAEATAPVRIEDLSVAGGSVVVEGVGAEGAPLRARDLDLRLSRLTTATVDSREVAFAVEMAVYGTVVHVTGQPRGGGYAIRVRARGVDVAGLARDFPLGALQGLEQGRGDVDAELLLSGGRVLASGHVRVAGVMLVLPIPGRPQLRAGTLAAAVDMFDLGAGTGRITRLDVGAPSLSLPAAAAGAMLAALVEPLRERPELVVRRVTVTDGTLALVGAPGVKLQAVQMSAQSSELGGAGPWTVRARAALGSRGEVAVDGVLARDFRELDATTRLQRVALAPWSGLTGLAAGWHGDVSFDGRLRAHLRQGEPVASLTGAAVLANVGITGEPGFRADRIAFDIRGLRWPEADPVAAGRGALRELSVELAPIDPGGAAHLRLSASTEAGGRPGLDRIVTYPTSEVQGLTLPVLLSVLEDAARSIHSP
jgi:hypothetical protein